VTTTYPLFSLDENSREGERRRKRIKTHMSMREMVVPKVIKKWLYKYHSSI